MISCMLKMNTLLKAVHYQSSENGTGFSSFSKYDTLSRIVDPLLLLYLGPLLLLVNGRVVIRLKTSLVMP